MRNLMLLLKVGILNAFNLPALTRGKVNSASKAKTAFFAVILVIGLLGMGGLSYIYNLQIGVVLNMVNALYLLPALAMTISSIITLMTTIYKAPGTLFAFKDYDTIMSLPVKTSTIVASRIIMVYFMSILSEIVVLVPTAIVYMQLGSPSPLFLLYYCLAFLFVPFVPIILGSIIGLIIQIISSRFRRNSLVSILMTIGFFVLVMGLSFSMGYMGTAMEADPSILFNVDKVILSSLNRYYPLASLFAQATGYLSVTSLLLFVGLSLVFFFVFCFVVGKLFKKMNTYITTKKTRGNYKMATLKTSSATFALYKRELKRLTSSSSYFFNTSGGAIMMTLSTIAMLIFGKDALAEALKTPELSKMIADFFPFIIGVFLTFSCTTCVSISLEGNSLWIAKSLPITTGQIFWAKILVNLTILLPVAAINMLVLGVAFQIPVLQIVMTAVLSVGFALFTAMFGLFSNLLFPKLKWTTETSVVKRSVSTMVGTFGAMILGILPFFACGLALNSGMENLQIILYATIGIIYLLNFILYFVLKGYGVQKFKQLEA